MTDHLTDHLTEGVGGPPDHLTDHLTEGVGGPLDPPVRGEVLKQTLQKKKEVLAPPPTHSE